MERFDPSETCRLHLVQVMPTPQGPVISIDAKGPRACCCRLCPRCWPSAWRGLESNHHLFIEGPGFAQLLVDGFNTQWHQASVYTPPALRHA